MVSGCRYAAPHSSQITANSESLTPTCGLSQVQEAGEACCLPPASLPPSVGHTHTPHPYVLLDTFSHFLPLTHTCAHRCRQSCSLPPPSRSPHTFTAHCPANKAWPTFTPTPPLTRSPPGFPSGPSVPAFPRRLLPCSPPPVHCSFSCRRCGVTTDLPFYSNSALLLISPTHARQLATVCNYLFVYFLSPHCNINLRMGALSVTSFALSLGPTLEAGT